MAGFEEVNKARELLGLGETATLKQMKRAYKRAANRYHPDKCRDSDRVKCAEMMKKVNKAYELITKYFTGYSYSFREEDVARAYPDDDYIWHSSGSWGWRQPALMLLSQCWASLPGSLATMSGSIRVRLDVGK